MPILQSPYADKILYCRSRCTEITVTPVRVRISCISNLRLYNDIRTALGGRIHASTVSFRAMLQKNLQNPSAG
jgi:hypothetical protein